MDRKALLLSMLDTQGLGLEIGPGFNPLLPKREGYQVETLDHQDAEALREKYRNAGVDLALIEDVDHVSDGGSILTLVGKPGHFDYIVASHVIEHTTDLLGFLKDCEALLKPSGRLVLAVPDKRCSFDCLRPCASTGQILQAHLDKRTRHSPGQVFDEIAYNCTRAGAIAWGPQAQGDLALFRPLEDAKEFLQRYLRSSDYVDIHGWQFTPSSFRLIVNDLAQIGALRLREQAFHEGEGTEFFVALSPGGSGCPVDRLALAQQSVRELRGTHVAGDPVAPPPEAPAAGLDSPADVATPATADGDAPPAAP